MFSIPYVKSLGIHVLLAIAFGITEFPLSGNSIPAKETCVNVSGEIICYFKGSEKSEKWNDARDLCRSFSSTLPVIRNRNDQDALAEYLKSQMKNSVAWTAGQIFTYCEWAWINGQQLNDFVQVQLQEDGELETYYAALDAGFIFTALAFWKKLPYICQYESAYCNSSSDENVNDKCLRLINDDSRTWYDARNQCLMSNGDLAVIGDEVHEHLKQKLRLNQSYWIGLRKKSWRWTLNDDAESNDEIKYTNWESNIFSTNGDCISIDPSNGKWKAIGCTQPGGIVVCQRHQSVTFPATTTKTSVEKVDSFTSVSEEGTAGGSQSSVSNTLLFAAVGAGLVIIICIIVIIVFVLRTKKGGNRQTRPSDSSPQNKREEFHTSITNTPVYTSVNESANAPVTSSDDIRGVYAEIPMSTANQSEDGATDQQPGIVYASLEFKEDLTNQASDKTRASTTYTIKVGPLGDIYVMPDATGRAVTSPGNDSASQPVRVNPQGEVVYANLQAEMLDKEQASEEHDHTK